MLPYLGSDAPAFAFLIHFRDLADIERCTATAFFRKYSATEDDVVRKVTSMPPLVGGQVTFGVSHLHGEAVCTMKMPREMMGPGARQIVIDTARVAVARGARVIGLGALTSPATGSGERLADELPAGVSVTTGNAYTAAVVRANVQEVCELLGFTRPKIAVVGCTGSVGVAASELLAEDGSELILIGRSVARVRALLGGLATSAVFTDRLDAVADADVVVLLTHEARAHVTPAHLRPGSVVIDVAQPPNVDAARRAALLTHGVLVAGGGLVRIPRYHYSGDLGIDEPGATFACLAETYLFAAEGRREHAIGRATAAQARVMERIAAKYGVVPVSLSPQILQPLELAFGKGFANVC